MDYSIDGEEVSQSPRTEQKPENEQIDFYNVSRALPRSNQQSPRKNTRKNPPCRLPNQSIKKSRTKPPKAAHAFAA